MPQLLVSFHEVSERVSKMTVTYTSQVTTSRHISNFLRLLGRWRGSIYKLVWMDLILFLILYILLTLSYRYLMNESARKTFEGIVVYCSVYSTLIPLSFVLGFFVTLVMGRWWAQYKSIPWPDSIALLVSSSIHGADDRARAMRRTIMRYVCLCQVIVFTMISPSVKKRFPTYNQIIEAGLLQENEKSIIAVLDIAFPYYPKHWMPIVWAASLVNRARRENKIRDDYAVKSIIDELNSFRGWCGFLLYYDWVSVPLVYTQVVTLACYSFFLCAIMGHQWVDTEKSPSSQNVIFKYFPVLTILQFFFYMGWLKVAESLINPFGEDDDDFELNWMIDRNLTVSYLIVDEMHQEHPQLLKDQYWDEVFPNELPYTDESKRPVPPQNSTARMGPTKSNLSWDDKNNIIQTSSIFLPGAITESFAERKDEVRSTGVPYNQNTVRSEAIILQPSPTSMNLEELIDQRNRERRERMRNRYQDMRSNHKATNSRYVLTVLRPPSVSSSQPLLAEEAEEEEEEEVVIPTSEPEKQD
ncbi:bestrophin-4 [Drosophila albomicans]|uniref:Bestrophin homolog n=1 Tax=Drosophila albomicans TaxID=7291 RepID=A0A6P8X9L0_DROAB|nr:bestrophin-4 [Drosophila albomicans]